MNVLMISPGYPGEMAYFTRGLAAEGARVIGLGDGSVDALDEAVRRSLAAYIRVPSLWDEAAVVRRVLEEAGPVPIHRVECLWEPAVILAGRLREALGAPGLDVAHSIPFRDKEKMKQVLDAAGIRTPRHARASSANEVRHAAGRIGFPVIVKPIAGAGSVDTHRIDDPAQLERVLPTLAHVPEVSVEEFVDGDELTFDTICADGEILFENVAFYRPRPIEEKKHEWVSPTSICLRELDVPALSAGRRMGREVLDALGFRTGFSHMEWYRRADGEVVFGEIGARPPGAHMVESMCYATDSDLFRTWAQAICHGRVAQPPRTRYNAAIVCKRAIGQGRVQRIEGLERLRHDLGDALVKVDLLPIGARRRDWRQTAISDGFCIVRHHELQWTLDAARRIADELKIVAG